MISKYSNLEIIVFNELKCHFIETLPIYFFKCIFKRQILDKQDIVDEKKNVEDIIPSNLWAQFGLYCHCRLAHTHPRSSSLFTT